MIGRGTSAANSSSVCLANRSYSERFCDVARKSKFSLTCDVAKCFRIRPLLVLSHVCALVFPITMWVHTVFPIHAAKPRGAMAPFFVALPTHTATSSSSRRTFMIYSEKVLLSFAKSIIFSMKDLLIQCGKNIGTSYHVRWQSCSKIMI